MSAPTDKQEKILAKYEKVIPGTFEEASAMIDEIAEAGWPATPKQAALLEKFGYDPDGLSSIEASEFIDRLKDNNWEPLPEDDE